MDIILWLQSYRSPFLDTFFKIVTLLGDEYWYLLLLPVLYWGWRKKDGFWLAVTLFFVLYINSVLKGIFAVPRPGGVALIEAEYYSFPSGHAMGSFALFASLALIVKKRWMWILSVILVFLIGLSRLYLGVHFPMDVYAGWGTSGLILILIWRFRARFYDIISETSPNILIPGILILLLLMLLIHPGPTMSHTGMAVTGAMTGMIAGVVVESRCVGYRIPKQKSHVAGVIIAGLLSSAVIYAGLKYLFPPETLFRVIRYFLLAVWISLGVPFLSTKIFPLKDN